MKYEIQTIAGPPDDRDRTHYRITDTTTDSRVATCYHPSNARLVCDALNAYSAPETRTEPFDSSDYEDPTIADLMKR